MLDRAYEISTLDSIHRIQCPLQRPHEPSAAPTVTSLSLAPVTSLVMCNRISILPNESITPATSAVANFRAMMSCFDIFALPTKQPYPERDLRKSHVSGVMNGDPGLVPNAVQRPGADRAFNGNATFFQPTPEDNPIEMISPDLVSFPNTSPNGGAEFNHSMMGFEGFLPGDFNFMSYDTAPRIVGGVDWLNLDLDSPSNGDLQAHYQNGAVMQPMYFQPSIPIDPQDALQNRNHQAISAQLMPIRNQESKGIPTKSSESRAATHQWPFDHTRNPESQRYRLPPLRDILQGTVASSESNNGSTIKSLIQLLSSPYLPEKDLSHDPNMKSAMELLKNSLDLYFDEFHNILPLVHVATFQMTKVPTVTLAAMACIGAMYSDDQHGTEQSWSLSEMCGQMIAWLVSFDPETKQTSFLISRNRVLLSSPDIFSRLWKHELYANADCSRGILMGCLRGMGLLKSRISTEVEWEDFKSPLPNENAATEWLRWKDHEQEKRIAWSSFEYDCTLCTLTSRRGAADLQELPSFLPCTEPLWDARSPQAWAALYSRLTPTARGASTAKVLRNLLAGKGLPEDLPAWGKRLCAQSIGRLLWDIKQLDIMATTEYLKLPSLAAAQRQTKSTLLQGLNALCESMYALTSTADLIHYNLTALICHYSHLYSADEAMDLIVHIFRSSASQSKQLDHSLVSATRRLRSILVKNPTKARNLAWHAAQIIAVANEYLVSAPCEIMRTFMGYIFILAFAKFGPQPSSDPGYATCPVRLDLPNRIDGQRTAIATWIENGGPASIGAVENIYSSGSLEAISHEAQTMLRKMRFWKLSNKFSRILESFDFDSD
ncbi:Fungal specific transcription factor domain-containing protein [Cladophialophora immunda]|nr:Fungal specific transcription factor domain-containing protein [Cladophialophora immunda]